MKEIKIEELSRKELEELFLASVKGAKGFLYDGIEDKIYVFEIKQEWEVVGKLRIEKEDPVLKEDFYDEE